MARSPFLIHRTTSSCVCNQQRTSLPPPPPHPTPPPPNKFLIHRTTSSCVCNQQWTSLPPPPHQPHPTPLQTNSSPTEQHHLVFAINNERHYPPQPLKKQLPYNRRWVDMAETLAGACRKWGKTSSFIMCPKHKHHFVWQAWEKTHFSPERKPKCISRGRRGRK